MNGLPDADALARIEARVHDIERASDAEVVVVIAARADAWADRAELAAAAGAIALGAVLLAIPWALHPWAFVLDQLLGWLALRWALRRPASAPWLARLATAAERRARAERAAQAEMLQESVHATPARTGVLVYAACGEGEIVVLPDLGVQGHVPRAELALAERAPGVGIAGRLDAVLAELAGPLAARLPWHAGSDHTDLPNAPRVRR